MPLIYLENTAMKSCGLLNYLNLSSRRLARVEVADFR